MSGKPASRGKPAGVFYSGPGIQISRDDLQWIVSTLAASGEKSAKPGELVVRGQTYHGTLAQACEEAATRMADRSEAANLREYAEELRAAVAVLRGVCDAHV